MYRLGNTKLLKNINSTMSYMCDRRFLFLNVYTGYKKYCYLKRFLIRFYTSHFYIIKLLQRYETPLSDTKFNILGPN